MSDTLFTGEISGGPARKYYQITNQGREQLEKMKADWRHLKMIVEEMGIE